MFFTEFLYIPVLRLRRFVACGTTADGYAIVLILQGLIIVDTFPRRYHGVRTLVASGAVNIAMPRCIPIQHRTGINLGNISMTRNTLGFILPRNFDVIGNRFCHLRHCAMAGDAVAIGCCMRQGTIALGVFSGVAIITGNSTAP